jgi:hypothetical protein
MKILMPINARDFRHAFLLSQRFKALGDMKEHSIFVTTGWSDSPDLRSFVENLLSPSFAQAEYAILPDPFEGAEGTAAASHMFYQSFLKLAERGNTEPICVLEADCFPVKAGWLDQISAMNLSVNKPFSGAFNHTYNREGDIIGQHLVGGAGTIYPADLLVRVPELEFFDQEPYDIGMADKVLPEALDMSESLIAHRWGTRDYYKNENGLAIGKDVRFLKKHTYEIPVPRSCVLIHGCKDESLFSLYENSAVQT